MSSKLAEIENTPTFSNGYILSPVEERFWCHFVNATADVIALPSETSSSDEKDPLISYIISNPQRDTLVLKSILCLGASHLVNTLPKESKGAQDLIRTKQCILASAVRELSARESSFTSRERMTTDTIQDYEALITGYMLLYLYHLSEGSEEPSWRTWLDKAREVFSSVLSSHTAVRLPATNEGENRGREIDINLRKDLDRLKVNKSVMRLFAYHDILAGVTDTPQREVYDALRAPSRISSQLLQAGYFGAEDDAWTYHGLLQLIAHVHALQLDSQRSSSPSETTIPRAVRLWQEIIDWRGPPDSKYRHLHEAYITAISIWIFCIIHPGDIAGDKVQSMVLGGLESLESVDESALQTASLFPFFIIGVCCIRDTDRRLIEAMMEKLDEIRGLRYIRVCIDAIRRTWGRYDRGAQRSWDWHLLIRESPGLLLA
ncbi:fungal-specific transcription factor domain-containing protein [Aspergillus pseudoustus]|uniref:Fungal-specific transcription factor domain-containing protein n=1 Tax=Aspergillus pseudoustus TaxID=1810923 RepID=A0ABR4IMS6_9EURO